MNTILRARWAWLPSGLTPWVGIEVDSSGNILAHHAIPPNETVDHALLLPGFINAHLHLELSDQQNRIPANQAGEPMVEWVKRSAAIRQEPSVTVMQSAAQSMHEAGVIACIDTTNGINTAPYLTNAGLSGTILHERLGWGPISNEQLHQTQLTDSAFRHRLTAHAPISCRPERLQQMLAHSDIPCTIHCDESAEDAAFLQHGQGPWAEFLDELNRPWRAAHRSAPSGVQLLNQLGLLQPNLGLVHLVFAQNEDLDVVAEKQCTAVVCPRSNIHISGKTSNIEGMIARDIPFAIGTDSLASSPDLDPLAEASLLCAHYPLVAHHHWIDALTIHGARLLNRPELGTLAVGAQPGVIGVKIPSIQNPIALLLDGTPWERYWAA